MKSACVGPPCVGFVVGSVEGSSVVPPLPIMSLPGITLASNSTISPGLLNALYDAGIAIDDVNPDYVIVGESASYSLNTLTRATNLVLAGAKLIGANSDVSGPIENGIAPACRALISPIEMATGKQAYFCGKPNPLMMRTGLNLLNCHSADAVIVGDRMDTDIISGLESGIDTVLVLSGISSVETIKTYAYQPTVILNGVIDIVRMTGQE